MKKIILKHPRHPLFVEFGLGFPDVRKLRDGTEYADTFKIITDGAVGFASGKYTVRKEDSSAKEKISKLLNIPINAYPVFGICLGYPSQNTGIKPSMTMDIILKR